MSSAADIQNPSPGTARRSLAERVAQPGVIAALWAAGTLVDIVNQLLFPDDDYGWHHVSSVLFIASLPVLAALVAAGFGRAREAFLSLAGMLLLVWLTLGLFSLSIYAALGPDADATLWLLGIASILLLVAIVRIVILVLARHNVTRRRRWAAAMLALSIIFIWTALSMFDEEFAQISARYAAPEEAFDPPPTINHEALWTAQPRLVETALAQVAPATAGTPTTYLVAVAAGGSQKLFGREARTARTVLGRAFGADRRSLLLANDEASLERVPLANNTNLGAVLSTLGKRADPQRDLVVLYLTAHGSKQAELGTNLPDYTDLDAIGAKSLAAALTKAGIRRRVIIVSACYSGSWIRPLASDDTIIVTAARSDRTSFGCTDERDLTYFGEALLKGPLATGASLADGFRAARRTVTKWEKDGGDTPSEPQAFVGKNMTGVWTAKRP